MKVKIAKGGLGVGTFNHRVIRHDHPRESWLEIHEVHYDADGNVQGWTVDGRSITGETTQELADTLDRMKRAIKKPILTIVKRGKRKILVELRPGSKEARGKAVKDLPRKQREELMAFKTLVEHEVDGKKD